MLWWVAPKSQRNVRQNPTPTQRLRVCSNQIRRRSRYCSTLPPSKANASDGPSFGSLPLMLLPSKKHGAAGAAAAAADATATAALPRRRRRRRTTSPKPPPPMIVVVVVARKDPSWNTDRALPSSGPLGYRTHARSIRRRVRGVGGMSWTTRKQRRQQREPSQKSFERDGKLRVGAPARPQIRSTRFAEKSLTIFPKIRNLGASRF
jgi:hypothetical protein